MHDTSEHMTISANAVDAQHRCPWMRARDCSDSVSDTIRAYPGVKSELEMVHKRSPEPGSIGVPSFSVHVDAKKCLC